MTITTLYKCDRCGHAQEGNAAGFRVFHLEIGSHRAPRHINATIHKEWCKSCCETTGVENYFIKHQPPEPPPAAPSLEELLREFIQEEITEALQNRQ